MLHFVSPHRRIKLKGRFFREFVQHVCARLDGSRSFQQIESEVGDLFREEDPHKFVGYGSLAGFWQT